MKKILYLTAVLLTGISCCKLPTDYVNPFIGTLNDGHCYPGATVPYGMVQPSPESQTDWFPGYEGHHVAGYQYNDPWITGFTQTHINGAGCPTLSDILIQPFCDKKIDRSNLESFRSTYDKEEELAQPGYYAVDLTENNTKVEMTAAAHTALYRITYDTPADAHLLIDLQYGVKWDVHSVKDNIIESEYEIFDDYTIAGYRHAREWTARKLFFEIRFNHAITKVDVLPKLATEENADRILLKFDLEGKDQLIAKIGLSTVSIAGAAANMEGEVPDFDFDHVRKMARESWNDRLSRVEIQGTEEQKISFYTALYHLYLQPTNLADLDGRYREENDKISQSGGQHHYSTFSLWDTYRAAHPLYTILSPEDVNGFIISLLDSYRHKVTDPDNPKEANKYLTRWGLWGREVHTMIGNHAVPVIADAWLKGINDWGPYTIEDAYEAMWISVTKEHHRNHVNLLDKYGYIPLDFRDNGINDGREVVSRHLEGIYDDWCTAMIAEQIGEEDDAVFLFNRAKTYANVFDPVSKFMRGRKTDGTFRENVNPCEVVGEWMESSDFTEGSAWHYTFHVQHDIEGLIRLMGGEKAFTAKLDTLFTMESEVQDDFMKLRGYIGQYSHGNEPSHHVAYLYKFTEEGWKTDALIREICQKFYQISPDGLIGNDDCGQMSAWYILSSMGLYPVNPCGGEFILGAPQLPSATLHLKGGKTFHIDADNISDENKYVDHVTLDGKLLQRNHITYHEIMNGGTLSFHMTGKHN